MARLLVVVYTEREVNGKEIIRIISARAASTTECRKIANQIAQAKTTDADLAAVKDEDIDYSDIPPISDERLAAMVRANQYREENRDDVRGCRCS